MSLPYHDLAVANTVLEANTQVSLPRGAAGPCLPPLTQAGRHAAATFDEITNTLPFLPTPPTARACVLRY